MTDTVLTRVAALKMLPIPQLKQQWRDLFETEPPPYNRRFLEHRLAYRIQELAYGGLKPETLKRLRVPDRYDDGGISGATLERPALKRLLADIEAQRVDVVVVYKIDRLSRALMDFSKLVEVFDRNNVTFVSVTQSFNTTSPWDG